VRLKLDRALLARYGLDVNTVAATLRRRIEGETATQIKGDTGDVDITVKVDYPSDSLNNLRNITIRTSAGALLRLESLAEFEIVRGPREIVRQRQQRVAYVMADLAEGVRLSEGIAAAQAGISDLVLPRRYYLNFTGEEEQRRDSFGNLQFALILSILLVYMVMASVFESFLQPFLILLTIPLAGVGVVLGLMVTSQTLNVMSIIGIVMLGGIVVNNAIVLLDCVNQVRSDAAAANPGLAGELSSTDSLVIGCVRRLRPVLMTSATTLLGLLPMAMGFGEGAELRQAMAITVLGGLLSSTALTLFVIPVAQSYLDSGLSLLHKLQARIFHRHAHDDRRRTRTDVAR
jgi:HAE1 family hydrophobic/amphiphilic exporter-1